MNAVATQPHVTLSGDINGDYVVEDRRPNGRLVLAPDLSVKAILTRHGERPLTAEEFEQFMAEYGPHMGPPDGEG